MKISGFTIVRNAVKLDYPIVESIQSILPICDEFIVNVGQSEDDTLKLINSINSPKIKIVEQQWDFSRGKLEFSKQTNLALKECKGDWAFYLQADEVVHEHDLMKLKKLMQRYFDKDEVEAFRFEWLHFFGSYHRFRDDSGWYQKQDRIIRNNGEIESIEDAYSFERKDRRPLKRKKSGCFIYHYGWVNVDAMMQERVQHHIELGMRDPVGAGKEEEFFKRLEQFPIYFGSHPISMKSRIDSHVLSNKDLDSIQKKHFFNPFRICGFRYKKHRGLIRKSLKGG